MHKHGSNIRSSQFEALALCLILVFVAVLIFAIGHNSGVDIGRDQVTAREHYDAVKKSALDVCADTEVAALKKCMIDGLEAAQGQSDSRQDLFAQQEMSRWAFWMMLISGFTLFTTFLGTVWVRDSLVQSNNTNKLIADQFAADHPPCFQIKQIRLDLEQWLDPENREGEMWIFNSGPTGARIHLSSVVFHTGEHPPVARPFDKSCCASPILAKDTIVGGGQGNWGKFTGDGCSASIEQIEAALVTKSKIKFYIIGRIHFRDVNKNDVDWDRHMVFCRVYEPTTKRFSETDDNDYEYQT
jgi:hypothetical protein